LRPAYPDRIEFTASDSKPYTVDEFFAIPDTAVRKYRLAYAKRVETGDIDVVGDWGATTEEARRYQADPSLKSRLGVYEFNIVRFLSLNVALPPFNDVHVRRAVNYVIDKKRVLEAWQLSEAGAITDHLAPNDTEDNLLVNYHPYPSPDHAGNLSAAQREMKLSAYDRNGDGTCDRPACDLGTVLWRGDGPQPDIARIVRQDLTKIGIRFVPKLVDSGEMYKACGDPTAHANLCQVGWVAGYPSASTFFPGLYSTDVLGSCCNYSVVGATSEQLRAWHYKVASVPNVDDRMKACKEAVGISHMQCWVAFDQYLMEEVVPAVPLWIDAAPWTFSSRVAAFSWDQVAGEPALDKIALKPST